MAKQDRMLIVVVVFVFLGCLFLIALGKVRSEGLIPSSVSFSGESNVIYFLDRDNAKLYRYNVQGRLTRSYTIKELGKNLE